MRYNMKIQYIIGILIAFLFASCSHEEEELVTKVVVNM